MKAVNYVKSFSQGQITIPKEIRDRLGVGKDFWLKVWLDEDRLIAEPVARKMDKEEYKKKLLQVEGDWVDIKDYKKAREELNKRIEEEHVD